METNNPAMKYLEKKRTTKEIKANNSTLSFDPGTWEIPSNDNKPPVQFRGFSQIKELSSEISKNPRDFPKSQKKILKKVSRNTLVRVLAK